MNLPINEEHVGSMHKMETLWNELPGETKIHVHSYRAKHLSTSQSETKNANIHTEYRRLIDLPGRKVPTCKVGLERPTNS